MVRAHAPRARVHGGVRSIVNALDDESELGWYAWTHGTNSVGATPLATILATSPLDSHASHKRNKLRVTVHVHDRDFQKKKKMCMSGCDASRLV